MGAIEQGGETARALIAGMKESPITLGLLLINMAFLLYIFASESSEAQTRRELLTLYIKHETEIATLLAKCIDPAALERLQRSNPDGQ